MRWFSRGSAAAVVVALVVSGCSSGLASDQDSQMVQIGDSVNLSLAGVNITGPKGTVIGPGTITVSRQRAEADMEGFTPASEGVEVALGGATLAHDCRRRLKTRP